jgi:TolB protein
MPGGGNRQPAADPVALVTDSLGTGYGGVLSPDGSRLAFQRSVAGRSHIFVAAADGTGAVERTNGVWDHIPVWSPDGRWIAYHAEGPDYDLFVVPVDGGAPRQLTSGPPRDVPRAWLPDGSGVIVQRNGAGDEHTIVVPLDGAAPRRLGPEMSGNQHAGLSPDGGKVGFDLHQGGEDATIWVQDTAGGAPRQLTTEMLENANPSSMWSPDGRFIAYTSRRTGTRDIWSVDVNSGETRQLTSDVRDDFSPRWSPDGRWMAFLSDRGGQQDIWVVPSTGGKAVRVTNDRAVEVDPGWSPDGRRLYYGQTSGGVELQLLPADSGVARSLLSWSGYFIMSAALSPDGTTILFDSDRSGNADIWSLPVSGGEPIPFAASPLTDRNPLFSRDGSQVLFVSDRSGSMDLWVMPARGGEPRRLTEDPGVEGEPAWSPDGKAIAFSSNRGGQNDLWVIPVAGGEPRRLTQDNLLPTFVEWSPDGTTIFFNGRRPGGGQDLYRIPAAGGPARALGARPGIGTSRLSPDGSQLSYSSFEGGWAYLDLIPASGGTSRRLTRMTENVFQPWAMWSPDGSFLAVVDNDFEGNSDATDLSTVRLSDGVWRRRTRTAIESEWVQGFTADSREILVIATTQRNQVMTVAVEGLLAGTSRE